MKHLMVFGFYLACTVSYAQGSNFSERASKLIEDAISEGHSVGIAAGFSVNGEHRWMDGSGYRDLWEKKVFEPHTLTRIASISKPMTAVAIMQLFEQRKLDLDAPIQTYLPDFPVKPEGTITIRHLLQHTSGIDDYGSNKERENRTQYPTLSDAVGIFKDRTLIAVPGTTFNYTTYGYVVLGRIIETVSGMSYESYMQKHIWNQAGMIRTGIEQFGHPIDGKSRLFHRHSKGKMNEVPQTNLSDRIPGGGVYSCVSDLLRFGDALLNYRLVKENTLKMMFEDPGLKTDGNGYGLGWYLYGENPKYGNVYGHNGTQTGASTFLMLLPEQHTSIVVLSNTSGAIQKVTEITIALFDIAASSEK